MLDEIGPKYTVDHQVRITTDRRSEVGVVRFVQAIMAVGRGAIAGLAHTAEQLRPKDVPLRMIPQYREQLHHLVAIHQIAHLDAERSEELSKFCEFFLIGIVV